MLIEVAFNPSPNDPEDLSSKVLDCVSSLAGKRGLSDFVLDRFRLVTIDVLARWLDRPCDAVEDWEQRLAVAAGLADTRPELWRCVHLSG